MAYEAYAITKILHVFFAVAWIGGGLMQQLLIMPVLASVPDSARKAVSAALTPQFIRYQNIAGGLTVLTGIGLVSMHPGGAFWDALLTTLRGRLVAFSLVGALAMLYLLNAAIKPTLRALAKAAQEQSGDEPAPGIRMLSRRLVFSSRLTLAIGLAVLTAMVAANSADFLVL